MLPFFISSKIISFFNFLGWPTKPISTIFSMFESLSFRSILYFVAWIKLFILPDIPTALPPEAHIDFTISEFISFERTSSTIFIVSKSVTLKLSIAFTTIVCFAL